MSVYVSKNVTYGEVWLQQLLTALTVRPAGPIFTAPKLRTSKDPGFVVSPSSSSTTLAANESGYSGYTAGGYVVTPSSVVDPGGNSIAVLVSQMFLRSLGSPDVGEGVTGWWISDTGVFVCGEKIANTIDMTDPLGYLDFLTAIALPLSLAINLS